MNTTFQSVTCKICNKVEICHIHSSGFVMLPVDWERFEDKTTSKKGPLTEVCGERCKAKLKELNRIGRIIRNGF